MKKIFLLLAFFSSLAFGADHLLYAPSGNLILDAKVGSVVKVNKTLRVDNITNLAGTSGAPGMVPIGGMVAVMPNTHANAWQPPATGVIKDGFMRADGAVVPACADCVIPAGTATPNMVTRFAKGSTTSGTTAGSATKNLPGHYHGHSLSITSSGSGAVTGSINSDGSHTHTLFTNRGGFTQVSADSGGAIPGFSINIDAANQGLYNLGTDSQGSHNHSFSLTSPNHTHANGNFAGTIGLASGSGGCDGNSGSSCSINVEPAYMEVVYIIRVK